MIDRYTRAPGAQHGVTLPEEQQDNNNTSETLAAAAPGSPSASVMTNPSATNPLGVDTSTYKATPYRSNNTQPSSLRPSHQDLGQTQQDGPSTSTTTARTPQPPARDGGGSSGLTFTSPTSFNGGQHFPPQPPEPASSLASPHNASLPGGTASGGGGSFGGLSVSGTEPKIFPGVVIGRRRQSSLSKVGSHGSLANAAAASAGDGNDGAGGNMGSSGASLGSAGGSGGGMAGERPEVVLESEEEGD